MSSFEGGCQLEPALIHLIGRRCAVLDARHAAILPPTELRIRQPTGAAEAEHHHHGPALVAADPDQAAKQSLRFGEKVVLSSAGAVDGPRDATGHHRRGQVRIGGLGKHGHAPVHIDSDGDSRCCGRRDLDAVGRIAIVVQRLLQHQQVLPLVGAAVSEIQRRCQAGGWHAAEIDLAKAKFEADDVARGELDLRIATAALLTGVEDEVAAEKAASTKESGQLSRWVNRQLTAHTHHTTPATSSLPRRSKRRYSPPSMHSTR